MSTAAWDPSLPHPAAERQSATLLRVAGLCLLGHAGLTLFSSVGFATFLAPPYPAWLLTPENQAVMQFMFKFGGQTTVVLGAMTALLHMASLFGARRTGVVFAVAFSLALLSEYTGTSTGYPFGPYSYTPQLGYLIGGRVPFNIPTSWFYMLYASLAICGRLLPARDDLRAKLVWAAVASLVLTAWDVSMDPAMVATTHWIWHLEDPAGKPAWAAFLTTDFFYGMPLTNWLGWLLTGFVVAWAMLALVPPTQWARRVAPTRMPLVLYAINGVLPVAICIGRGLWIAAVAGTVAMAIPLALAVFARRRAPAGEARLAETRTFAVAGD
ncbi:carotenoid biosynthesis protein [Roseisolibacter sp. H3M3-2]|uniref:carotenoid biosynthesis protein n=1 Tax=Roseisolibacter sp. H3M3-2 TaxID=3031323 RepID=UPI0023D9DC6B|nr:carotenoid biosynthesis protein [Roseisolibacter sp. H3M3-2]MDF1505933.1 carotenoid biosynthesis protein [Roseisolibacter sp. H3M3-2]